MSNRTVRVNELIQREISDLLHTRYQGEAVRLTITAVDVAPDLRNGRVYYSILGDEAQALEVEAWLRTKRSEIRHEVGRRVTIKFLPHFEWKRDESGARGSRLTQLLDEIDEQSPLPPPSDA